MPRREEPRSGVSCEALAESVAARGHRGVRYAGDLKAAAALLAKEARAGDVVLTLGAGNVWTAGDELLRRPSGGA